MEDEQLGSQDLLLGLPEIWSPLTTLKIFEEKLLRYFSSTDLQSFTSTFLFL